MPRGVKGSGPVKTKKAAATVAPPVKKLEGYTAWSTVNGNRYGMCVTVAGKEVALCGTQMTPQNAAPLVTREDEKKMVEYVRPFVKETNPYVCRECAAKLKELFDLKVSV